MCFLRKMIQNAIDTIFGIQELGYDMIYWNHGLGITRIHIPGISPVFFGDVPSPLSPPG